MPTFWRDLPPGSIADDLDWFLTAAGELGFTERTGSGVGSQVIGRLLIQTGRRLHLVDTDLDDLLAASATRHGGTPSRHYTSAVHAARQILFHLDILTRQPVNATSLLKAKLRAADA